MEKLNFPSQKVPFFCETNYLITLRLGVLFFFNVIPQKPIGIFDTRLIYKKDKLKHQRNVF